MSQVRAFSHPAANSTTIMPTGKIITFGGLITGKGDQRVVHAGYYETSDPEEIAWLEELSKSRTTMVTEVKVEEKTVTPVAAKLPDPSLQMAAADAAKNTALDTNERVQDIRNKLQANAIAGAKADGIAVVNGQVVSVGQPS